MNFLALPVRHFSTEFLEGDFGLGIGHPLGQNIPTPMFRQFYDLRNSVLRVCHHFGTVGCAGDYQWNAEQEGPYLAEAEIVGDESPDFFVVDELWNPVDKYVKVEPDHSSLITLELLSSLVEVLSDYPDWAIGLYLENGCVLVFPEKLMVKGPRFETCFDVVSVAAACTA
jgi:hypothetical protein